MTSPVTIARRYKASIQADLKNDWESFKQWGFDYLIDNLELLSKAVGSSPLTRKIDLVKDLKRGHQEIVAKYSRKFDSLDKEALVDLRKSLSKELAPWCRLATTVGFDDDDIWNDVEKSDLYKTLAKFDHDRIVDRIGDLPEDPTEKDLAWLKKLDLRPFKEATNQIRRALPDLEPKPSEQGSYEVFEGWIENLPANFGDWEDNLPFIYDETLADVLAETGVWKTLRQLVGPRNIFDQLQGDAKNLRDSLKSSPN